MAILAGDALLNYAYETILSASIKSQYPQRGLKASYEIARAAGIYGMVGGQVVDVESESIKIDKEKMDFIHKNKTAAMIVACMRVGAILAGAEEKKLEALTIYGEKIGLAFQIVDDLLDILGDEASLGKHVGSDIENEKSTYPSMFGIEKSWEMAEALIEDAKEEIKNFDEGNEFLLALSDYIIRRKY